MIFLKKRKFQKSESKSKRKKGTLVGNTILLVAIAVLVVSMLFTLCAKIVDKNDAKEELSSASDELLTLASEEESDSLTEAPTTEAVLPTEWAFYVNDQIKEEVEDEYDCYDRYLLYDGEAFGVATVASEQREVRSGATPPFHKFQVMYCFDANDTVRIEAPTDCRVAFTGADSNSGTLMLYECFDYPAGVHTFNYPDWADVDFMNVVVFYEK